jgi:hypothetical protein
MKTPTMVVSHLSTRKRPVNLTLNEVLVERARRYTVEEGKSVPIARVNVSLPI